MSMAFCYIDFSIDVSVKKKLAEGKRICATFCFFYSWQGKVRVLFLIRDK